MKRPGNLSRSPLPPRRERMQSGRIKAKKPSAAEQERKYGSESHRAWMKRQPCVICGRTPSDAAHITNGGIGRKDSWARTLPLCSDYPDQGCIKLGHHSEYDAGKKSFVAKYAVDLPALAAACKARWQAKSDLTHIGSILPGVVARLVEREDGAA